MLSVMLIPFFRHLSGFGVTDQSLSTMTGTLVSQIMEEMLKDAWRWAMEVIYSLHMLFIY